MRKLLSCTTCLVLFFNVSFCQENLKGLMPKNEVQVGKEHFLYSTLLSNKPEIKDLSPDEETIIFSECDSEKGNYLVAKLRNEKYHYVVLFHNIETNEDLFFYLRAEKETENDNVFYIYDQTGNLLYQTVWSTGKVVINYNPDERVVSCFKNCMSVTEDEFEDTFAGWVIWNLNPQTQVMAAVHCNGCCKKWWSGGCDGKMPTAGGNN